MQLTNQYTTKGSRQDAAAAIRAGLSTLFKAGQVVEIRAIRVDGKRQTASGYFNDFNKLAQAVTAYDGRAQAIYFTLNPVNPALLARANNRMKDYAETTTSDRDILRRCWFGLDFDPVRPADISSSDEEHGAALDRAEHCLEYLTEQGWPAPLYADSGNGAHLLYAIDLPNDETSADLIKSALAALAARFDDARVKVDLAVFNASRIWKLYGTLACKGDNMPERPHRRATILKGPSGEQQRVSREQLAALAAQAPQGEPKRLTPPQPNGNTTPDHGLIDGIKGRFDLVAYAQKHFPGGIKQESHNEVRILGNGGLMINTEKNTWYHFTNGSGGDALDLVGYVQFGTNWTRSDQPMFQATLQEAAREVGVRLPEPPKNSSANGKIAPPTGFKVLPATIQLPPVEAALPNQKLDYLNQESRSRAYYYRIMNDLKKPEWLMNLVIPKASIGILWGQSGIGKSFITLHVALTQAVNDWVWYIANEGFTGYGVRMKVWVLHNKQIPEHIIFRQDLQLLNRQDVDDFIYQMQELDQIPKLIIVDSLAGAMVGGDDSSAQDIGLVSANLRRIANATGSSLMVVHHPTKDNKTFRGSGSLFNNFDFVLSCDQEDDQVIVKCDKMKEFDPFPEQRVAFLTIDTGEVDNMGNPVTSRVIVPADKVVQTKDDPLSPLQRRIAELLAGEAPGEGLGTGELLDQLRVSPSSLHAALSKLKRFDFVSQAHKGADYVLTDAGQNALNNNVAPQAVTNINMSRLLFPNLSGDRPAASQPSPLSNTTPTGTSDAGSAAGNSTSPLDIRPSPKNSPSSPHNALLFSSPSPTASPTNSIPRNQSASPNSTLSTPSPITVNGGDPTLTPQLHTLLPSAGESVGDGVEREDAKAMEMTAAPLSYEQLVEWTALLGPDRQEAFLAAIQDSPVQSVQPPTTGAEIDKVLEAASKAEADRIKSSLTEAALGIYYDWLASSGRRRVHSDDDSQPALLGLDNEDDMPSECNYYAGGL